MAHLSQLFQLGKVKQRPRLLTVVLAGFTSSGFGKKQFADRDFKGRYGYSFEAQFGQGLALSAVEAGTFTADGKGTLVGAGTAITERAGPIATTYECSYVVEPDGRVHVECARTSATTGPEPVLVKFLLLLVNRSREAPFVGIPTGGPFSVLRLIGSVIKQ